VLPQIAHPSSWERDAEWNCSSVFTCVACAPLQVIHRTHMPNNGDELHHSGASH